MSMWCRTLPQTIPMHHRAHGKRWQRKK